jgi:hypothetical protein
VLIILGGLLLLDTLNLIPEFPQEIWAAILTVTCLFFIGVYFYTGRENWPWLFPIFISGGLALTAILTLTEFNPIWIGALFMAFISAPFWIVFLFNRKENWWALIPGWATAVITLIILISEVWPGETIGALVMWSIALPFFVVYLRSRKDWWALIPAFIMGGMGFVVLLAGQRADAIIGTFVMLVIALPFFAVFFFAKGQWWAIIPAGIMTTIAIIIPFAESTEPESFGARLVAAVMFLGFALPFAWLWFKQSQYPTVWAKYPTVGFIIAAIVTMALGGVIEFGWPVVLIVIGAWLLYDNFRQPKLKP